MFANVHVLKAVWGLGQSPSRKFAILRLSADQNYLQNCHCLMPKVAQNFVRVQIHCGPSQPNYCEGPDLRTLTGSTPMPEPT